MNLFNQKCSCSKRVFGKISYSLKFKFLNAFVVCLALKVVWCVDVIALQLSAVNRENFQIFPFINFGILTTIINFFRSSIWWVGTISKHGFSQSRIDEFTDMGSYCCLMNWTSKQIEISKYFSRKLKSKNGTKYLMKYIKM